MAALVGLVGGVPVLAAAITVSPTRIELSAHRPVATLEVRNEGDESVTIQLERTAWTQEGGVDVYSSSAALIATPSVFELAPHGSQTLRIALRDPSRTDERAYRLYADEVSVSALTATGLRMALRIGIPIFAVQATGTPRLNASVDADSGGGGAIISLRNDGSHFARAIRVQATDASGAVLWQSPSPTYLLAKGEHQYRVDTDAEALLRSPSLQLSIVTETGVERIEARRRP